MNVTTAGTTFFLAMVAILAVCRLVSWVGVKLGQPPVVGEMVAGVLLGPSLLGLISPAVENLLFPASGRALIYVAGQIGLVLFMFGAGYEFSTDRIRKSMRTVGAISLAGNLLPLALGVVITLLGTRWTHIVVPGVSLTTSAAFVGVALAITAFPMMARMISERGISDTKFGSIALACGALDDVLAWLLLAIVISMASGSSGPAIVAGIGAVVFAALLLGGGRQLLSRVIRDSGKGGEKSGDDWRLLFTAIVVFGAAWFTDRIGLYAVFGAFCVGVVFPRNQAADRVMATIAPLARIVFVPLFFTYSGLNTKFGLLANPGLLGFAALAVVVAIVGKLGACWGAARAAGEPKPIAARIGILMNGRGLMQLIAINVGLQVGIVSSELFSVLVLVALVTTIMTAPLLTWYEKRAERNGLLDVPASLETEYVRN
ncbi:MAG TPA: cation:proton antiporter [Pseudonocardiaceae bacterium]|nr:cation:proton antiporter [Pseudonocardiaceae bacterium]